jgi:hypothetical protein
LETLKRIILILNLLSVNDDLLESLIAANKSDSLEFVLHLDNTKYALSDVSVAKLPTPVNSPTTRGGVYFSDKFANKIKGTVADSSIIAKLSKTMLGPNTEFGEIKITTQINIKNKKIDLTLFANLTNSVQISSSVELNMIIVKLDS